MRFAEDEDDGGNQDDGDGLKVGELTVTESRHFQKDGDTFIMHLSHTIEVMMMMLVMVIMMMMMMMITIKMMIMMMMMMTTTK